MRFRLAPMSIINLIDYLRVRVTA